MEQREAASVVAVIAAAYPQWPASKETVAVYADALADLDHAGVVAAVRDIILTDDRWPTIATIRRRVGARLGTLAPTPAQAWGEITRQADEVGRTGIPVWSHPAVAETVRAIGWYDICMSSNPETLRAQFQRMYADAQQRHDHSTLVEPGALSIGPASGDRMGGGELAASTL